MPPSCLRKKKFLLRGSSGIRKNFLRQHPNSLGWKYYVKLSLRSCYRERASRFWMACRLSGRIKRCIICCYICNFEVNVCVGSCPATNRRERTWCLISHFSGRRFALCGRWAQWSKIVEARKTDHERNSPDETDSEWKRVTRLADVNHAKTRFS